MTFPHCHLSHNTEWIFGAVRSGGIAGEFLVRQVRVIFNRTSRLHQVDSLQSFSNCQFSAPNSSIQSTRQVDVFGGFVLSIVRIYADPDHITRLEISLRAVEVGLCKRTWRKVMRMVFV